MAAGVVTYRKYVEVVTYYDEKKKVVQRVNDPIGEGSVSIVKEQIDAALIEGRKHLKDDKSKELVRTRISIDTMVG